jgi:hypothetical protein
MQSGSAVQVMTVDEPARAELRVQEIVVLVAAIVTFRLCASTDEGFSESPP